jgi:anti-sigma factor RsiW
MPCDKLLVHAYFDHELEAAQSASMESHLQECPGCRQVWDELHWLQQALGPTLLQAIPDSPVAKREPANALQFPPRKSQKRSNWSQLRSWGMALAASLVVVLGGTRLLKPDSRLTPSAQPGVYSLELPSAQYEVSVQGCQLLEVEIRDDQHLVRLDGLAKQSH